MNAGLPSAADGEALRTRLEQEGESAGYYLNPDLEFTRSLTHGLLVNDQHSLVRLVGHARRRRHPDDRGGHR